MTRKIQFKASLALPIAFALIGFFNLIIHLPDFDVRRQASSFAIFLIPVMAIFAPTIRDQALKIFVLLVCIEVGVGFYEYCIDQVALFSGQIAKAGLSLYSNSDLLYETRVFGLSNNSSVFAEKIFIALLLLVAKPELLSRSKFVNIILLVGLVITFNRTAILAVLVFYILHFFTSPSKVTARWKFSVFLLIGVATLFFDMQFFEYQFLRGGDTLSGSELRRFDLWSTAWQYISQHPLWGNGSLTFRMYEYVSGHYQHAHNSFLMLVATHGLVASLFLFSYIGTNINSGNWRVIVTFLAFSMTQYFIFWNLSVPDLMFYWMLGQPLAQASGTISNANLQRVEAKAI
jgi:O-antigen ligase